MSVVTKEWNDTRAKECQMYRKCLKGEEVPSNFEDVGKKRPGEERKKNPREGSGGDGDDIGKK